MLATTTALLAVPTRQTMSRIFKGQQQCQRHILSRHSFLKFSSLKSYPNSLMMLSYLFTKPVSPQDSVAVFSLFSLPVPPPRLSFLEPPSCAERRRKISPGSAEFCEAYCWWRWQRMAGGDREAQETSTARVNANFYN